MTFSSIRLLLFYFASLLLLLFSFENRNRIWKCSGKMFYSKGIYRRKLESLLRRRLLQKTDEHFSCSFIPLFSYLFIFMSLKIFLLKLQFLPALPFHCPLFTHPPDSHSLRFFLTGACQMCNGSSSLLCYRDCSILSLSARKYPLYL